MMQSLNFWSIIEKKKEIFSESIWRSYCLKQFNSQYSISYCWEAKQIIYD